MGLEIEDETYRNHLIFRHGLYYPLDDTKLCSKCNKSGGLRHELGCVVGYGELITQRHDLVKRTVYEYLQQIGGVAKLEHQPFRQSSDSQRQPDIVWRIDNRNIYFDVSITHPLSTTTLNRAAQKQLAAATIREKRKNDQCQAECQKINFEFIPLVVETFGGLRRESQQWIGQLSAIASKSIVRVDGDSLIYEMLNKIALHVARLNSAMQQASGSLRDLIE